MQDRQFSYGYSGELRDRSGLLPYGFRALDPSAGRWSSSDPAQLQGSDRTPLNFYQVVDGNPATHRDDRGLMKFRDLHRILQLMITPLNIPNSFLPTDVSEIVFDYADVATNPYSLEWIHPINWEPLSEKPFGAFHRVEVDEMIRQLRLPFEVPNRFRKLIVKYAAWELFREDFKLGGPRVLGGYTPHATDEDQSNGVFEGLRAFEIGLGGSRLVLAAVSVFDLRMRGVNRFRKIGPKDPGKSVIGLRQARVLKMLAVLFGSLSLKKFGPMKNIFSDQSLRERVEVKDYEKTGIPLLGAGRNRPFTSKQPVIMDMGQIFAQYTHILQPIMARLIFELGASTYRGSVILSNAIIAEELDVIRVIAADKTRNKVKKYNLSDRYIGVRKMRQRMGNPNQKETKPDKDFLLRSDRGRRFSTGLDRQRVPGRQAPVTDYHKNYRDFLHFGKLKSIRLYNSKHTIKRTFLSPFVQDFIARHSNYDGPPGHSLRYGGRVPLTPEEGYSYSDSDSDSDLRDDQRGQQSVRGRGRGRRRGRGRGRKPR